MGTLIRSNPVSRDSSGAVVPATNSAPVLGVFLLGTADTSQ